MASTPALEGHFPPVESLLARRLKDAHGIVLGKLRMHELGGGDTTVNPVYGRACTRPSARPSEVDSYSWVTTLAFLVRRPTLNPHNVTHHPGGSSGGNGAAIAAHAAVVSLCADSGGSCRSPAAMSGVVGYRPSTGCFNGGSGVISMGTHRDTVGIIARSVADVRLVEFVLTDCYPHPTLPHLPARLCPLASTFTATAWVRGVGQPPPPPPSRERRLRQRLRCSCAACASAFRRTSGKTSEARTPSSLCPLCPPTDCCTVLQPLYHRCDSPPAPCAESSRRHLSSLAPASLLPQLRLCLRSRRLSAPFRTQAPSWWPWTRHP